MKKNEYYEKLKSPKWQKKRLEILERDNFMCQVCFDKENTLAIHHLDYEYGKDPWDYPDENLLTLCATCHDSEKESRKEIENTLLSTLRLKKFMAGDVLDIAAGFYYMKTTKSPDVTASIINWLLKNHSLMDEIENKYFKFRSLQTLKNKKVGN